VESADAFYERAFAEMIVAAPELALALGVDDVGGRAVPLDSFGDYSDAGGEQRMQRMHETLAALRALPAAGQSRQERLTGRVFEFFLEYAYDCGLVGTRGEALLLAEQPLQPGTGLHVQLPVLLANLHPITCRNDANAYIRRLSLFPRVFADLIESLERRASQGNLMPRVLMQKTLGELRELVAIAPETNPLCSSFASRLADVPAISADAPGLLERVEREIRRSALPAFARVIAFLEQKLDEAPEQIGLCRLPEGEACYDFLLRAATTTPHSAKEIHAIGLQEMGALESRLDVAFREQGRREGSVADRCRALDTDARFLPARDDRVPARLMDGMRDIIAASEVGIRPLFDRLPRARVELRPVPDFAEQSRHHTYQPPAVDGTRPGILEVNLSAAVDESMLDLRTLCYHEAWPGHHLQLSLAQELDGLPSLRRMVTFDAYIEGWAKYAETIPWTHGIDRDPNWNLARMRRELISTANLVLDSGVHDLGWSRDDAIRFSRERTGASPEFSEAMVDRIAGNPGQTSSYKVGMRTFFELHDRMRDALGSDFDIRVFHDSVLANGSLPLAVLEEQVAESIAHAQAGSAQRPLED
jgi:uncharacterized protein (DUF885 family)